MKTCCALLMMVLIMGLTGGALASSNSLDLKVKWRFKTEGAIRADTLVAGDTLFVASTDGRLYALNKESGKRLWKFKSDGALAGKPAVSGNLVVVVSRDNKVYALHRHTGKVKWTFRMQAEQEVPKSEWKYFSAAPVIAQGKVYIGSGDNNLYVLDQASGRLEWKFRTRGEIRAAALVHQGAVYQPSNDGAVYVLDAATGALRWTFKTEGFFYDRAELGYDRKSIYTQPIIAGNTLVIGSRDGNVYAVDLSTHAIRWKFTDGSAWVMTTATDQSSVYVGWSSNNMFSALDLHSGAEQWRFYAGSHNYTTAFVDERAIRFGSADGKLYTLDKFSGSEIGQYSIGQEIFSSPVYDTETQTLFIGSDDGNIYAMVEGEAAYKAVYQPLAITDLTQYLVVDPRVTPYLTEHGYAHLQTPTQLQQFMQTRIADGAPSVIVFALPVIPSEIMGTQPAQGMMREYLESGGKVLWFSDPPNYYSLNEAGNDFNRSAEDGSKLLGVKFTAVTESGNYFSKATQEGKNWGLPKWLKATSTPVSATEKGVTALAFDEFDRVSIWVKHFSDKPGSGYVSMRTFGWYVPIRDEELKLIDTVASYGLE